MHQMNSKFHTVDKHIIKEHTANESKLTIGFCLWLCAVDHSHSGTAAIRGLGLRGLQKLCPLWTRKAGTEQLNKTVSSTKDVQLRH